MNEKLDLIHASPFEASSRQVTRLRSGKRSATIAGVTLIALWVFGTPNHSSASTVQVNITFNQGFNPQNVDVWPGDTVDWHCVSGRHTSTSDVSGLWDSGQLGGGQDFSYVVTNPNNFTTVYSYHCNIHPNETGTVTVHKKWPVGFYSLTPDTTNVITGDPLLQKSYVAGFRLRLALSDIQPTDSTHFDWTKIDNAVTAAKAAGKKLGVSIAWGRFCPDWLFDPGLNPAVYKFTIDPSDNSLGNGAKFYEPLPWDTGLQHYLFNFIDQLATKYDKEDTIQYVVLTGFQQMVENRLINNDDASVTGSATISNANGQCKVVSNGARFITRTGGGGINGIIGKTVTDDMGRIPTGAIVASNPTPTDNTVYLNMAPNTTGSANVTVLTWLVGLGDQYKADQQAISLGFVDSSPALGDTSFYCNKWDPPSSLGFACVRAYIPAIESIFDYWAQKLPNTPLILTGQSPFSDGLPGDWNQKTQSTIKNYLTSTYKLGGFMTASLYAICAADYTGITTQGQFPKGDQMIHALGNDMVYSGGFCADGHTPPPPYGAQRVYDACEAALEHGDSWFEPYYPDLLDAQNQGLAAAWTTEAPRFAAPTPTPTPTPTPCPP